MRAFLGLLLLLPLVALAAESLKLDAAPIDTRDAISIQRGARVFVNYCLTCHSASSMRYNRLQDAGLAEQQIKQFLMFGTDKAGSTMTVAMRGKDGADWFGVTPPDLSVIARSRGPDWLYSYMRTFYRDDKTTTGWNNLTFENVAMPHVLWQLQGQQRLVVEEHKGEHGTEHVRTLKLEAPGQLSTRAYDALVADLVNYLVFMGEPARQTRIRTGYAVLIFLGLFFIPVYFLKKAYWDDVR